MKKIILIDDDHDDASLLQEALTAIDATIQFAHFDDGIFAIRQLREQKEPLPDLVFLDINIPGCSGWSCLRQFKESPALRHIPVIMYTTSSLEREKFLALENGAQGYITKPDNFNKLKNILAGILAEWNGKRAS